MRQIEDWLAAQGFQVWYRARARNWIAFSGTVQQAEKTFRTSIRRYVIESESHYANSTDPFIPSALGGVVSAIRGLDDFRLKPLLRRPTVRGPLRPEYTHSGQHNLAPDDVAAIYDLFPLYNAGFDGTGQKIAIMGQTDIVLSDIAAFRSIFNLSANVPQLVLYGRDPGASTGDQQEAALDLEWSGAVARNATILYVYSTDVFSSLQYAVDQNLAPVISMSYGSCESADAGVIGAYRTIAQQAASQGISWVNSSGDSGAADCDSDTSAQATHGKAVLFPASIPEVTAAGGTEFNEGNGVYWSATNSGNEGSATGYIPEMAWNDTSINGTLTATGGGVSSYYPTPAWQTGAGFPNDGHRDVPDIAMAASADHDGFMVCVGGKSCTINGGYSIFGGTSASAPVFAGVLAILNHYLVSKGAQPAAGLGSANQTLYSLAQTNPSAFHDVTTGNNIVPCKIGTTNCTTGSFGYTAGTGYDQTTGLGSVDAYNLATAWAAATYPRVTSISPATPVVSGTSQTVTVSGSGFQAGLTVSLTSPGSVITTGLQASSVTSTSFQAALTLNAAGTWQIQAIDADGHSSNLLSFTVNPAVSAPVITSVSALFVSGTGATLSVTVNPDGASTLVWFLYATASNLSGAVSTSQQGIGSGTGNVIATAGISGLTAGTTYYYQALASNSSGTTKSGIASFTTSTGKTPVVTTGGAYSITGSTAMLGGTVNPNGVDTKAWFEYGTSSSMSGAASTAQQDIGSGSSVVSVNANVTGLAGNTTYYFQAWASNSNGTSQGAIFSFTSGQSQVPIATTLPVSVFGSNTATVVGSVNPNGLDTVVWFQYSTNSSLSGSFVLPQQDAGSGIIAVPVSARLSGLAAGTTYYFQVLATNNSGTSQGAILSFNTTGGSLPAAPSGLSPVTGATGVASSPVLSWNPSTNATGYTIYFGVTNPPPVFTTLSGINSTSYAPGLYTGLMTYYWQVVATNSAGNASSAVSSFTTGALSMPGTKAGVFRNNVSFLEDTNGNGAYDPGVDRFIASFTGPNGYQVGDVPVVGDWTGDGHAKVGIYRTSTGTWYLDANNDGVYNSGDYTYSFGGLPGDMPVVGDWNGVQGVSVHKSCIGIYRSPQSQWLLDLNCNGVFENTPTDAFFPFGGLAGDVPVVGNWTGGTTRVGVVRVYAPNGIPQGNPFFWVLDGSDATAGNLPANHQPAANCFPFGGLPGDVFITGDWNNGGAAKAGVFRSGAAGVQPFEWVLDANGNHTSDVVFNLYGLAGDVAVTGKW